MYKLIASVFGIGYFKGGGTAASFITVLALGLAGPVSAPLFISATVLITALGVWSGNEVERHWGKDSYRVVIDEVAGMCVTMLFVTSAWTNLAAGFVLFRFFDMTKPLYIRRAEYLPGGWGVMADDILAGVYANVVLQILLFAEVLRA